MVKLSVKVANILLCLNVIEVLVYLSTKFAKVSLWLLRITLIEQLFITYMTGFEILALSLWFRVIIYNHVLVCFSIITIRSNDVSIHRYW